MFNLEQVKGPTDVRRNLPMVVLMSSKAEERDWDLVESSIRYHNLPLHNQLVALLGPGETLLRYSSPQDLSQAFIPSVP